MVSTLVPTTSWSWCHPSCRNEFAALVPTTLPHGVEMKIESSFLFTLMSTPLVTTPEGVAVYGVESTEPRAVSYGLSTRPGLPRYYINVESEDRFLDAEGKVIMTIPNKYRSYDHVVPPHLPLENLP